MSKSMKVKGLYFDSDLNITPSTEINVEALTPLQVYRILKSDFVNSLDQETFELLKNKVSTIPSEELSSNTSIPLPERINQVYGTKMVDGILKQSWMDLSEYIQDYVKIEEVDFTKDWSIHNASHDGQSFVYTGGVIPQDPIVYQNEPYGTVPREVNGFQAAHKIRANYRGEFTLNYKEFVKFGLILNNKDYDLTSPNISLQYDYEACALEVVNSQVYASTGTLTKRHESLLDKPDTITIGFIVTPQGTAKTYIVVDGLPSPLYELKPSQDNRNYNDLDTQRCKLTVYGLPKENLFPEVTYKIEPIKQELPRNPK